ncbi:MAG: FkbM family methyltransferase [Sulfuriferula multivorans]|uniref:FkbM family methyltransferase n=1 Tax=Sulfuriferula multivorans TaxID=1559896 RepID=A0A7C9P8B0_9PROT|nr:FkbM family methyltransferase [Sulfuriferula multivorans]
MGKLIQRINRGLSLSADFPAYMKLETSRLFGGQGPHPLRLRYKRESNKYPVWFRNKTTDYATLVSCFVEGYHRPVRPLSASPVILDLGSNVGYTIIDFKYHYPNARVYGVEMDEKNFSLCQKNLVGLLDVEVIHAAVWYEDTQVEYDADAAADAFTIGKTNESSKKKSVPALSLPTLLSRWGLEYVDFIKLDIEGAEKQLFELGDSGWLERVGQISIELHGTYSPEKMAAVLQKYGMKSEMSDLHWSTVIGWRD